MRNLSNTLIYNTLLVFFLSNPLFSQVANFDQIVPPEGQRPATFEDYLVQLAWQNTQEQERYLLEKSIAEKEVGLAKGQWMDQVQLGFNLNEVSLANVLESKENKADNIIVHPLYQFSASVSLGTFTNNRKHREIAEINEKMIDLDAKKRKLALRAIVLSRYQKYLTAKEVLLARTKGEEDSRNNYEITSQRFKNGDGEIEDLNRASESYYNALEKKVDAEAQIQYAIIDLEEVIGVKWEMAERYGERLQGTNNE